MNINFHSKDCSLRYNGEDCTCGYFVPGERCSVCGKPFTQKAWDKRHTDPRDGMSDCHAGCCPFCHGNGPINHANKIPASEPNDLDANGKHYEKDSSGFIYPTD
jgi:hypothetical protein